VLFASGAARCINACYAARRVWLYSCEGVLYSQEVLQDVFGVIQVRDCVIRVRYRQEGWA
jgi:hypothetical protein